MNKKLNPQTVDVILVGYESQENLGLRSIAAYLCSHGVRAEITPYKNADTEKICKKIKTLEPKLVGFSLIFQAMIREFAEFLKYLRSKGVTAHFTMGGHFPTIEYTKTLEFMPELDTVIRHEGELTILELYETLDDPSKWPKIKGIAYRKGNKVVCNPPRPLIENLDTLPFPTRPKQKAHFRDIASCSVSASRGCYYDCSFCSIRQFYSDSPGLKRRSRSAANVAQELEQLYKKKVKIFKFVDDDLGMKSKAQKDWIYDFAHELGQRKLGDNILWRISSRVDELDLECLRILKEVGLKHVYLGIESGSDQGLITCNKHFTVKDIYHALDLLEKAEVKFEYGFMILTPETTFETLNADLNFMHQLTRRGRAIVHFARMFPYAGTSIANALDKQGRLKGAFDCPTYGYYDNRVTLMEAFLSRTFQETFFGETALLNKLQFYDFDVEVLKKFYSQKVDVKLYEQSVAEEIVRYNQSVLETVGMALNFISNHDYEDALFNWEALNYLSRQEHLVEAEIEKELMQLEPQRLNK
jgi:anaerobic magnesium-protoporphyrin IX monomethyl ester cyclase